MVIFGLIGYPLGHSFSANYFNNKFSRENIDAIYYPLQLTTLQGLPSLIIQHDELIGLNVTIPYKQSIMSYLNSISEEASLIGAVNVISIDRTHSDKVLLRGYNTDWIGFKKSLLGFLKEIPPKALILGAGGAARAVIYALHSMDIECTVVSRRIISKNLKVGDYEPPVITYDQITQKVINEHHLIINTTPLGMFPDINSAPNIPYLLISKDHFCYDLVYNPELTKFLKLCEERGAKIKNGFEMLELQAREAWKIWKQSLI